MPERYWLRELNERDRDIYEAELMYDAWLERRPQPPPVLPYDRDDGYDPRDPYDRLRSEGGHLGE